MRPLSAEILAAGPEPVEPISSAGNAQLGLAALAGIAVIVVLITRFKVHAFLALTLGTLVARRRGGGADGEDRRELLHRAGRHGLGRGRPHRARCDPRQAPRRLRRRRPDRRHDPREDERARDAVGDGADRRHHRAAALLRGRHRADDPRGAARRAARQLLADAHRHSGARGPLGDARPGATAPRTARRHRLGEGRPRRHTRPRRAGGRPHTRHRGPALRTPRRRLGQHVSRPRASFRSGPPRTWSAAPASPSPWRPSCCPSCSCSPRR